MESGRACDHGNTTYHEPTMARWCTSRTRRAAANRGPGAIPSHNHASLDGGSPAWAGPPSHDRAGPSSHSPNHSGRWPIQPGSIGGNEGILDLEFVEISEVTCIADNPQIPGRPPPPVRPAITDISQWVERFSLMATILATRFPLKAPEFWAYQATIVRAERNYEGTRWVAYDRQFRREALARRDLNWSVTDTRLYNEAFTGRARAIARCSFCLQDDHAAASCPQNPNRPVFGWFPDPTAWAGAGVGAGSMVPQPTIGRQTAQPTAGREACRRYNEGKCRSARCRYLHSCTVCQGPHLSFECPRRHGAGCNRSPPRPPQQGLPQQYGPLARR